MKIFRQPTRTEYKGVVYRSTCEAMFARYLELQLEEIAGPSSNEQYPGFIPRSLLHGIGGFLYDPNLFAEVSNNRGPDFLYWTVCKAKRMACPTINYEIIKYEPSKPTEAFVSVFASTALKCLQWFEDRGHHEFSRRCSITLYYGSVYTEQRGMCFIDPGDSCDDPDVAHEAEDWLANYEQRLKETWFDFRQ